MFQRLMILGKGWCRSIMIAALLSIFSGSQWIPPAAAEPAGFFSGMDGAWKGNGKVKLSDGQSERIRCRAKNRVKKSGDNLRQDLRCASASYKLTFKSDLTYKAAAGVVTGTWRELSYGVGGFIMGPARNGRVRASVSSDSVSAIVAVVTKGNKQSVTITPKGLDVLEIVVTLFKSK